MGNTNVIEFPKSQSVRKRMQDRVQEQKSMVILSIASVLLMTLFLNQWLVRSPGDGVVNGANRGVASFEPSAFVNDVKWEHDLASRMAKDTSPFSANLGESPTLRDDLIFGYLEGKYGMKLSKNNIQSLEFIDAQAGDMPLQIADKAAFLKKYSAAFGVEYAEVSLNENTTSSQVYSLIDKSKKIVGKAQFMLDDQGRVQEIKFEQ